MKTRIFPAILLITLSASSALFSQSGEIPITDAVVERYIRTFPGFHKLNMELSRLADDSSVTEDRKTQIEQEYSDKRTQHILSGGWKDIQEFVSVHARVVQAMTPMYMMKRAAASSGEEQQRLKAQAQSMIDAYTAAHPGSDLKALGKNYDRIKNMFISAGLTDFEHY